VGARRLLRRARVLIVEVREIDLDRRRRPGCGQAKAIERFGQLLGGEINMLVRGSLWSEGSQE
jgi:hypothetical protein